MPTRAELKANAKQALTGKWGKGALITLCYVLVAVGVNIATTILSFIPFIGLATTIITIPLALGLIFSFIKLKRGEEVGAFDFLKLGFQNFKRSWCLTGRTLQKMLAPIIVMCVIMVVMMISGGIAVFSALSAYGETAKDINNYYNKIPSKGKFSFDYDFSDYDFDDISYTSNPYARSSAYSSNPYARDTQSYDEYGIEPYSSSSLRGNAIASLGLATGSILLLFVLMIAMWGVSIWATVKGLLYALTYYIAYDNPEMSAKDAVQRSEDLMKGNRGKLFVLQLSFIGWAILAAISFGIGMLWLLPYMMITLVCFYEALAGGNNGNINATSSQNVNAINNPNNTINSMNNVNNMNNPVQSDMNQMQNINNTTEPTPAPNVNQYNSTEPINNENQLNPTNNDFNNPNNNM